MATNKPNRNFFRKNGGHRRNEISGAEEFFNLVKRQLDKAILLLPIGLKMDQRRIFQEEEEIRVVTLNEEGFSQQQTALPLWHDPSVVSRILREYQETENYIHRVGQGILQLSMTNLSKRGERYREVQRLKCEALLEGLAISSLPLSVLHLLGPSNDCGCGCESAENPGNEAEEVSDKPYGPLNQVETDLELICEHFMLPDNITVDAMKKVLADPEEPGDDSPLHIAIRDEDIDVVKALLNFGADVNAKGHLGQTPILTATIVGSIPILELLIDRGGDLTKINDNKSSALHIAVQQEWPRTTRWLLNKGLDINVVDSTLSTPLHWAAFDGNIPMVKLLVGRGAKIDIRNDEGHTPFDIARAIGTRPHKIVAGILRSRIPKTFSAQKKESVNLSHDK